MAEFDVKLGLPALNGLSGTGGGMAERNLFMLHALDLNMRHALHSCRACAYGP